jgi:hypothetical protein
LDAIGSHASKPAAFGGVLEVRRHAEPVRLLVVEDVATLHALSDEELGIDGALVGVVRGHPRVVAGAARVVLVRFVVRAPWAALGDAHVGVRGREEQQAAPGRLVEHRDLHLRAAGVERADHGHEALVARVGVRVLAALARIPLAGLRRRVVAGLVRHVEVAGLPVALLKQVADRADDLAGLRPCRALQRQVGRDQHVRIPLALVLEVATRGGRQRLDRTASAAASAFGATAALIVAAATAGRGERKRTDQERE